MHQKEHHYKGEIVNERLGRTWLFRLERVDDALAPNKDKRQ
jgi:hypothetical protein